MLGICHLGRWPPAPELPGLFHLAENQALSWHPGQWLVLSFSLPATDVSLESITCLFMVSMLSWYNQAISVGKQNTWLYLYDLLHSGWPVFITYTSNIRNIMKADNESALAESPTSGDDQETNTLCAWQKQEKSYPSLGKCAVGHPSTWTVISLA